MICVQLITLIDSVPSSYAQSRYFLGSPNICVYSNSCSRHSDVIFWCIIYGYNFSDFGLSVRVLVAANKLFRFRICAAYEGYIMQSLFLAGTKASMTVDDFFPKLFSVSIMITY